MKSKTKSDLVAKLQKHVDAIAKERDALRKLVDEYMDIADSVDDGLRDFQDAIDTLSQRL